MDKPGSRNWIDFICIYHLPGVYSGTQSMSAAFSAVAAKAFKRTASKKRLAYKKAFDKDTWYLEFQNVYFIDHRVWPLFCQHILFDQGAPPGTEFFSGGADHDDNVADHADTCIFLRNRNQRCRLAGSLQFFWANAGAGRGLVHGAASLENRDCIHGFNFLVYRPASIGGAETIKIKPISI